MFIPNVETIAVDAGASMTVGATTVVLDDYNGGTYGITVAGTLTATDSTFSPHGPPMVLARESPSSPADTSSATNTTFGWDAFRLNDGSVLNAGDLANDTFQTIVFAPGTDIPLLAGSNLAANKSFEDIDINAGSLERRNADPWADGLGVDRQVCGTSFPSGYEVKSGGDAGDRKQRQSVHS